MKIAEIVDGLRNNWPIFSGIGAFVVTVWRWDLARLVGRALRDRIGMALENADLRHRFRIEEERGDYWEAKCDELERRFQDGMEEVRQLRSAIRIWRQRLLDLICDREAAITWGATLADTLDEHGIPQPMDRPRFLLSNLNLIDPLPKENP